MDFPGCNRSHIRGVGPPVLSRVRLSRVVTEEWGLRVLAGGDRTMLEAGPLWSHHTSRKLSPLSVFSDRVRANVGSLRVY